MSTCHQFVSTGGAMVTMIVVTPVTRLTVPQPSLGPSAGTTSGPVPVVTSAYPSHSNVTGRMIVRT